MRTLRIAMALALSLAAHAQTSRGTVAGTVLDQSGAVIRGARVGLTGVDTGAKLSTESNESGVYRFDAVDLGTYDLDVAHPGFRSFHSAGIRVEANRTTTFDPRLEVGAAESRIEVSAESSEMLVKDSPRSVAGCGASGIANPAGAAPCSFRYTTSASRYSKLGPAGRSGVMTYSWLRPIRSASSKAASLLYYECVGDEFAVDEPVLQCK